MKKIIAIIVSLSPSVALAQPITDVYSLADKFTNLGNLAIRIMIAFAVIWIIFNVVRFIISGDNPEKRKEYQGAILWGIVGLFIILSIWGLVRILTTTFRTADNNAPTNQYPYIEVRR